MADDDGFGPAARGGRGGRARTSAPPPPATHGEAPAPRRETPAPHRETPAPSPRPQDDFGPPLRGRGSRRRGRRVLRTILVTLLVLLLVAALTGTALALYTTARINRVDVGGLQAGGRAMNVLLVGSDSREGLSDDERRDFHTGTSDGLRTDTILLLSVSRGRAAMLSFPRDLFVRRCDGSEGRINGAHQVGGPTCLVETVTELSGIPVDRYLEVDFRGFVGIIDAAGGVSVYLEEPIDDWRAGLDLDAGCQRLDGPEALGYVRTRQGPGGDFGRVARQQRFLKELAKELAAPRNLVNVPRLFAVAGAGGDALTADRGLGLLDLGRLGWGIRGLAGGASETYVVPATPAEVGGAAVLRVEEAAAEELFSQFRDGSVLGLIEDVRPEDVTVTVLNGAGISGLAARGQAHLENRGFTVSEVGNTGQVERTVVRYRPGLEAEARLVAEQISGATTERASEGPELALVLGADAAEIGDEGGAQDEPAEPRDDGDEPAPAVDGSDEPPVGAAPPPQDC